MIYIAFTLLFFYFSTGLIIGMKIMQFYDRWYSKLGCVMFKIIFWLPNIPADLVANNIIDNNKEVKR